MEHHVDKVVEAAESADNLAVAFHQDVQLRSDAFVDEFYKHTQMNTRNYCGPRHKREYLTPLKSSDRVLYHFPNQGLT